jgi:hypothetical protein
MVAGSYGRGSIGGGLLAIVMTAAFGLTIVLMRRWKHVSMIPAVLVIAGPGHGRRKPTFAPSSEIVVPCFRGEFTLLGEDGDRIGGGFDDDIGNRPLAPGSGPALNIPDCGRFRDST